MSEPEKLLPLLINRDFELISDNDDLRLSLINSKSEWLNLLHLHGALLFRGFDVDESEFEHITCILTEKRINYNGGDTPRKQIDKAIYTSTELPSDVQIPMHHELSYSNTYPRILYFCCIKSSEQGGETPLLDSRKLYAQLPNDLIQRFEKKKLKYLTNLHNGNGLGKSWMEYFEVESKDEVEAILKRRNISYVWKHNDTLSFYEIIDPIRKHPVTNELVIWSQADQWHPSHLSEDDYHDLLEFMAEDEFYHNCQHADGSQIDTNDLNQIRKCNAELMSMYKWEKGDFLIVDNILVMHGRMPYVGERKIIVAMG